MCDELSRRTELGGDIVHQVRASYKIVTSNSMYQLQWQVQESGRQCGVFNKQDTICGMEYIVERSSIS